MVPRTGSGRKAGYAGEEAWSNSSMVDSWGRSNFGSHSPFESGFQPVFSSPATADQQWIEGMYVEPCSRSSLGSVARSPPVLVRRWRLALLRRRKLAIPWIIGQWSRDCRGELRRAG